MYTLRDLVEIDKRFQNSVNLQLDLENDRKLNGYIPTRSSLTILSRYVDAVLKEQGFCRISRSTIINLKHYVRYIPDKSTILLHNNTRVAISRRYVTDFKKGLHAYQIGILNNGI